MKTIKILIAIIATASCIECSAFMVTKDYGNGVKVYEGNGTTRWSFDGGNSWITVQRPTSTPYYNPSSDDDEVDRFDDNDFAAKKLVKYDIYLFNDKPCRDKVYKIKDGCVKKLDTRDNNGFHHPEVKGKTVNLKPKSGTLNTYKPSYKDYLKYVWLENVDKQKFLETVERYYDSKEFRNLRNSFGKVSKGEYGVYEIKYPVSAVSFIGKGNVIRLKRGLLVDAGTFVGMLDWMNEQAKKSKEKLLDE